MFRCSNIGQLVCSENYSIRTQILSYVRRGTPPEGLCMCVEEGVLNLIAFTTEEEHPKPMCGSFSATGN